jgi:hypothetical protein
MIFPNEFDGKPAFDAITKLKNDVAIVTRMGASDGGLSTNLDAIWDALGLLAQRIDAQN